MVHVSLEVEGWSVTLEIDTFYYDNYESTIIRQSLSLCIFIDLRIVGG